MTNYARISPTSPQKELASRELARRHLLDFTTYTYPGYVAEPAHALIAQRLEAVIRGNIRRLMIFAPPQHGKTELVSVRFPAFWLANRPNDPVMLCSYGATLAYAKSWEGRGVLESPAFQNLFDVKTDRAGRARDHWRIDGHRGQMVAAGVGGPITGHGAMLGIIDDPIQNWEQAQSETIREKHWDWFQATFRTRIWEEGAIVLVMTRWHEDDLAGRLLQHDTRNEWAVLRLPAVAETQEERNESNRLLGLEPGQPDPLRREPGEPLCPRRFSRNALEQIRRDVGSMAWFAEYQGVPRAPEGNRFKRSWFPLVDAAPAQADRVRYWDKAGTAGGGAYTAGVRLSMHDGLFYVEDVVRGQWSAGERERVILQTAQMDGMECRQIVEQEPGSGGKESAEATIRNLAGFSVYADKVTGDKDVRLEPLAAQAEAGNLRVIRGYWNAAYIDEMCAIPAGQYRDQGDASAGAFNHLAQGSATLSFAKVRYGR